jgi:hypothetical protein
MKQQQKHIKSHCQDIELAGEATTQQATPVHGNNDSRHTNIPGVNQETPTQLEEHT